MKILGVVSGIGSMMIGARDGNEIVGNIEWRPYYHTGTFEANFPGSFMVKGWEDLTEEQIESTKNLDLLIGHPECGHFSNMNTQGKKDVANKMDIPFYIDVINKTKPKFFAADNLPKSLLSVPLSEWKKELPDYNVELAWVSNYNYGNVQKYRNRLFIIGSLKELNFKFIPGEVEHEGQLVDVLTGLGSEDIPEINHVHKLDTDRVFELMGYHWALDHEYLYVSDFKKHIKENRSRDGEGRSLMYYNKAGERKLKPGYELVRIHHTCPVITGREDKFRLDTSEAFTIRERARMQGVPDDFIFHPTGRPTDIELKKQLKQTGKCMPVQFCTYLTNQIQAFLEGKEFKTSGKSFLKPNKYIEESKQLCADLQ